MVDVVDMNLNDVVKLIRGTPGTVVRLKVVPNGQKEPKVYNITRATEAKAKKAKAAGTTRKRGRKYSRRARRPMASTTKSA